MSKSALAAAAAEALPRDQVIHPLCVGGEGEQEVTRLSISVSRGPA